MTDHSRYAIYLVAEPGPLADFSAKWLGWDIVTGTEVQQPSDDGFPLPVKEITASPAKYGFHGTIKPPFRLAPGRDLDGLIEATTKLLAKESPMQIERLRLVSLGSFLALIPARDTRALRSLAEVVVTELDAFRAPMTSDERARRNPKGLSARQKELLDLWGYPYVLEEFQFHMTLSGNLSVHNAAVVEQMLAKDLSPLLADPLEIKALSICGERPDGRFEQVKRVPLGG